MEELVLRVETLERRTRLLVLIALVLVAIMCLTGAQRSVTSFDTITARKLAIVDEQGREYGGFSVSNGESLISLKNSSNNTSLLINSSQSSTGVTLLTAQQKCMRIFNAGNMTGIEVRDPRAQLRIILGVGESGKGKVHILDPKGKTVWQAPPTTDEVQPADGRLPQPDSLE